MFGLNKTAQEIDGKLARITAAADSIVDVVVSLETADDGEPELEDIMLAMRKELGSIAETPSDAIYRETKSIIKTVAAMEAAQLKIFLEMARSGAGPVKLVEALRLLLTILPEETGRGLVETFAEDLPALLKQIASGSCIGFDVVSSLRRSLEDFYHGTVYRPVAPDTEKILAAIEDDGRRTALSARVKEKAGMLSEATELKQT